ncbi:MAG: ABC transporter permease [Bacteroidetes bacterium]|nr:ABC transporter permease [Bacteroidota bacterium]
MPPRWANRLLEWYCRPELLEEIQGDAHELYYREAKTSKRKADWKFIWNVIRFFRWRNIRKRQYQYVNYSIDMIQNIFKVAFRNFLRHPGHSFLNVIGLGVSFVVALLVGWWALHENSFDRFHENPEQIFEIKSHVNANGTIETYGAARFNINLAALPEVKSKTVLISGTRWPNELCFRPDGKSNECIYLFGIYAEQPFFSIFNFPIVSGNQNPLAEPTHIAISQKMANKLYGDENPIGKIIKIDDHYPVTIASVFKDVPSNSSLQFEFVLPWEVFAKMRGMQPEQFHNQFFPVYFRTSADATVEDLTAKLNSPSILTEDLKKDNVSYSAFALTDARLHGEFKNGKNTSGRIIYVQLFLLVAMLVVAMAVINFVNLTTARASNRAKEIGIRKVTGAQRGSIIFQFMGESFFVVFAAIILAVVTGYLLLPLFNQLVGDTILVTWKKPAVIGYIVLGMLIVAFLAGLYPALVMSRFQAAHVLKGNVVTRSAGAQHLRKILLVVQISFSVGIVIFTGVLFKQLDYIQHKNLGLNKDHIVHIEPTYKLLQKYNTLKAELLKNPQIKSVTATAADPTSINSTTTGVRWPGMTEGMNAPFNVLGATHEVADVFGLNLVDGRFFGENSLDSIHSEVVVSESAVKLMNLDNPLGTLIKIGDVECNIIGVIKDFHSASLKQAQLPIIVYRHPTLQCSRLYVRYEGETTTAISIINDAYKKAEPAFTMKYGFVDDAFAKMYKTETAASKMLMLFTAIAVIIALVGVIGLATYNVIKRKKEIGIKRVFGASSVQLLGLVSKDFVLLILLASAVGMPVAWYSASEWLSGYAYRIDMPWEIFALGFFAILSVTLCLISLQALKTIRTNPTEVLRSE